MEYLRDARYSVSKVMNGQLDDGEILRRAQRGFDSR